MRFDFTDGKEPKYIVTVYRFNQDDKYYFSDYKEARKFYKDCEGNWERFHNNFKGGPLTVVSLSNMITDKRLEFRRFGGDE